jgi:hypothetical protein
MEPWKVVAHTYTYSYIMAAWKFLSPETPTLKLKVMLKIAQVMYIT